MSDEHMTATKLRTRQEKWLKEVNELHKRAMEEDPIATEYFMRQNELTWAAANGFPLSKKDIDDFNYCATRMIWPKYRRILMEKYPELKDLPEEFPAQQ